MDRLHIPALQNEADASKAIFQILLGINEVTDFHLITTKRLDFCVVVSP